MRLDEKLGKYLIKLIDNYFVSYKALLKKPEYKRKTYKRGLLEGQKYTCETIKDLIIFSQGKPYDTE